jgi:hypothetical protein
VPGNYFVDNSLIWGDYYFVQGCYRAMGPPPQVTGLTAQNVSFTQVPLTWQAQSGAIRYNVKRSVVSGGPYTYLAPPPVLTTNTFTDNTVAPNMTYYYVVSASSAAGEGPNSTELVVTTPSGPADFSISSPSSSVTVSQSGSAYSAVTVASLAGFAGPVALTTTNSAGLQASLSPTTIIGSGSAIMRITAAGVLPGTYTLTVTGTSGTQVHSTSLEVTVVPGGSFTLTANPSNIALTGSSGKSAKSTISAKAVNGFAGTVSLAVAKLPAGLSASISPTTVTAGGAGATLTIKASPQWRQSSYSISVMGTSNGVPSFTLDIPVQITR